MTIQLDQAQSDAALKGFVIPARPAVLQELEQLLLRETTTPKAVADRIARDVTLSGAVLKTVNSPLFGLRSPCSSVPHAVHMLGLRNVTSLVRALVLRRSMGSANAEVSLERFWDSAETVATLAAQVAGMLPRVVREDAYSFGLFRDVGIPMLLLRWPEYKETLKRAAGDPRPLPEVEEERHGTNHTVLGYLVARSWGLPEHLCEGIQRHHDPLVFVKGEKLSGDALTLIAINRLAEHLHDNVRRMRSEGDWERDGGVVLEYLGISQTEYRDLADHVAELIG